MLTSSATSRATTHKQTAQREVPLKQSGIKVGTIDRARQTAASLWTILRRMVQGSVSHRPRDEPYNKMLIWSSSSYRLGDDVSMTPEVFCE